MASLLTHPIVPITAAALVGRSVLPLRTRECGLALAAHRSLFDEYRGPKHQLTARSGASGLGGLLP